MAILCLQKLALEISMVILICVWKKNKMALDGHFEFVRKKWLWKFPRPFFFFQTQIKMAMEISNANF